MAKSFDELANRTMTPQSRTRAAGRTRHILAVMLLAEVRAQSGKSQSELARALGIKQPSLSKLEHQDDMQISTLRRIIDALGGQVEIIARFPTNAVRLGQFRKKPAMRDRSDGDRKAALPRRPSRIARSVHVLQPT